MSSASAFSPFPTFFLEFQRFIVKQTALITSQVEAFTYIRHEKGIRRLFFLRITAAVESTSPNTGRSEISDCQ